MNTPNAAKVRLCPGTGVDLPSLEKRPEARAKDNCSRQTGKAAHGVNHDRAGEIVKAHRVQPATAPLPRSANRVDESGEERTVDQVSAEFHATGNGPRDDRRGGGGEGDLEQEINLRVQRAGARRARVEFANHRSRELEVALGRVLEARVHQSIADEEEQEHTDGQIHQVLAKNVHGVLGRIEARLKHGEPGLHEENQHGTEEQCDVVYGERQRIGR